MNSRIPDKVFSNLRSQAYEAHLNARVLKQQPRVRCLYVVPNIIKRVGRAFPGRPQPIMFLPIMDEKSVEGFQELPNPTEFFAILEPPNPLIAISRCHSPQICGSTSLM